MVEDWSGNTVKLDGKRSKGGENEIPSIPLMTRLDSFPLFVAFTRGEKEDLIKLELPLVGYDSGQVLIRKGEQHRVLYMLLHGSLLVTRPDLVTPLARLESGAFFGEMSFLKPIPRQTSVVAEKRSLVMKLDRMAFDAMPPLVQAKIKDQLLEVMVERLAAMNDSWAKLSRFAGGQMVQ